MSDKINNNFSVRFASTNDIPTILKFIRELAAYEKLENEVTATEDILKEWIFEKNKCEVLIALENNEKIKLFPKRNYEFRSFFEDEN